jgi:hypothetical protein
VCPVVLDPNDQQTVMQGAAKRLLRDVPSQKPDYDDTLLHELMVFITSLVQEDYDPVEPLDLETWLASTHYTEEEKNFIRERNAELHGGFPTQKQCDRVKNFIKKESYPEYKHARHINPRSVEFNAFSGPAIKAVEQLVYSTIPFGMDYCPFIKHVPVDERPRHIYRLEQANRWYFMSDFTAFESHFTSKIMNSIECVLYRHVLQHWKGLNLYCKTITGKNRIRNALGLKFDVEGRRMSGDTCTSLGNGFTNYALSRFIAHKLGIKIEGFVEGDDGIFSVTAGTDLKAIRELYERLGFTIKIESIPHINEGNFCGCLFSSSMQTIKNPFKVLQTFGWTFNYLVAGRKTHESLLRSKAMSLLYEVPACPILSCLGRHALRKLGVGPLKYELDYYRDSAYWARASTIDISHVTYILPDTRILFFGEFGVPVDLQVKLEELLDQDRFHEFDLLLFSSCGHLVSRDVFDHNTRYLV